MARDSCSSRACSSGRYQKAKSQSGLFLAHSRPTIDTFECDAWLPASTQDRRTAGASKSLP